MTINQANQKDAPPATVPVGDPTDLRLAPYLDAVPPSLISQIENQNSRYSWDRKSDTWKDFVSNLKASGVTVPLQVTKRDGKLFLLAGERRLSGAFEAGLELVPVCVYDELTDEEASYISFNENFGRADLHPLEEGLAVEKLLEVHKNDFASVASVFGRSESWVRRRARLCDLSQAWRKAILDTDSKLYQLTAGHLALVSRFPEDAQDAMMDCFDYGDLPTIKEMEKGQEDFLRLLGSAPFPLDKKVGQIAACNVCPKRSSASPGLFDAIKGEEPGKGDKCLDEACWQQKLDLVILDKVNAFKIKHKDYRLLCERNYEVIQLVREKHGKRLLNDSFKVIKKATKGKAHHPALWVQGPKAGTECLIRITEQSWQRDARLTREKEKAKASTPEAKAAAKAEKLAKKRNAWMLNDIKDRIEGPDAYKGSAVPMPSSDMLLRLLLTIYQAELTRSARLDILHSAEASQENIQCSVWRNIKEYIIYALGDKIGGLSQNKVLLEKGLGIDIEALNKAAIEAIPTPKSRKS